MNKHYEDAETLCNYANVNTLGLTERQIIAAQAQVQATLALAYEQRTANLLAALDQVSPQDYAWLKEARENPESDKGKQLARWDAIGRQVEERLGLA